MGARQESALRECCAILEEYDELLNGRWWEGGRREQIAFQIDRLFSALPDVRLIDGVRRSPMLEAHQRGLYLRRIGG